MKKNLNSNKGQVALIVLLVAAVVMTVGMSLSKKAVVDTNVATNEELAKQAFNAAESGVSNYLGTGSVSYTASDTKTGADVTLQNVGNGSTVNFNQFTLANQSVFYWLVSHDADANIDYNTYYSGNSLSVCVQNSFNGALKIDYFYRDSGNYLAKRYGYNINIPGTITGFTDISPIRGNCINNYLEVSVPFVPGVTPLLLSVKAIGKGTKMYLVGSGQSFPVQGEIINSNGKAGALTTSQQVNRQIGVLRVYDVSPFLMDSVVGWGNVLSN